MSDTSLARRAGKWVSRRTVEPVVYRLGQLAERRVRRVGRELPEPPRWIGAAAVVVTGALSLSAWLVEERRSSSTASERATAEPERGSDPSEPSESVRELARALDTLGVEYPPVPDESDARAAWRREARKRHPDAGGDAEAFKEAQAAWERVEEGGELSAGNADGEVTGR